MDMRINSSGIVEVLSLAGRFDSQTAPRVLAWLNDTIDDQHNRIVVNLENVSFVDSTALSTLVHGMKGARAKAGDLCLSGLQQPVRIIFELTRLDRVFDIYNTEEDAVQALATPKAHG